MATASSSKRSLPPTKPHSPPTLLPIPTALRQNRSFATLARLIGLAGADERDDGSGSDSGSEAGDDDDDDDGASISDRNAHSGVDEESLMWDAQTALISHRPALAAKYYATAALPPYRSAAACLALGNLLARGSSLSQTDTDPTPTQSRQSSADNEAVRSPTSSWFPSLFRVLSPTSVPESPAVPAVEKPSPPVVRNGWDMPRQGKRAIRDVENMGKAGGWLILGIGWILAHEMTYDNTVHVAQPTAPVTKPSDADYQSDDGDSVLRFDLKGKGRARPECTAPRRPSRGTGSTSSTATTDSLSIRTPSSEDGHMSPEQTVKLLYDLLTPLLHLYRHGHIQKHDPVALPPLQSSQLPSVLQPQGDSEKGQNVWLLGSKVASKLVDLPLLAPGYLHLSNNAAAKRKGSLQIANYILGITTPNQHVAEASFKAVLELGYCGLDVPDELLHHAYRRLKVVLEMTGGSPADISELEGFPFPLTSRRGSTTSQTSHRRKASASSTVSAVESTRAPSIRYMSPVKSCASMASLAFDAQPVNASPHDVRGAANTLRKVQRRQEKIHLEAEKKKLLEQRKAAPAGPAGAWWPSLNTWSMSPRQLAPGKSGTVSATQSPVRRASHTRAGLPSEFGGHDSESQRPLLRTFASSPALHLEKPDGRRRLPFEPTEAVASIDPELAALELASALTKHVKCGVCNAAGVNFPNCRKCGLTFCSRKCRVDETGAGNGKRHICGAWESRQLLKPPIAHAPKRAQVTMTKVQ